LGRDAAAGDLFHERAGGERRAEKDLSEANLLFAFRAPAFVDDDFYAARIAASVVGGGMSSRLFQEIREKRGLAYSVFSSLSSYADTGILKICAGTTPEKAGEVLKVTGEILSDLTDGRLSEEEVALAKELIKGSMLLSMESPGFRMTRLAMSEMFLGRFEDPMDEIRKVDEVTPDGVRELASRMLLRERFSLAALGDLADASALSF